MSTPVRSTQHAATIAASQASQNTAPVAEFRCLFTHDVRRKQKRWQDGYLKFHTFNNRVMVYDEARNFLGDTYHKDSNELHEGDELNLDKGIMVEVAEALGITQTDLTALLEKKPREPSSRPMAASQSRPFQRPASVAPISIQHKGSQLRHKSLNSLLGTTKGPIGKAQPIRSPYEARKEKENDVIEETVPKRPKTAQSAAAWRASSPVQEESPIARRHSPVLARLSTAQAVRKPTKFVPPSATVITIDSEIEHVPGITSDVTLPSTPPRLTKTKTRPLPTPEQTTKPPMPEILQAHTPKLPRGRVPVPSVKASETPQQKAPPSSPPVSASNRLSNIDMAVQPTKPPPKQPSPVPGPPRNATTKSLRLSTGVKRGTLLCQAMPQQNSKAGVKSRALGATSQHRKLSRPPNKEAALAAPLHEDLRSGEYLPTNMVNKLHTNKRRKVSQADEGTPAKRARISRSPPESSLDISDDPEIMHGILDQQLYVFSSALSTEAAPSITRVGTRKKTRKNNTAGEPSDAVLIEAARIQLPVSKDTTQSSKSQMKGTMDEAQASKALLSPPVLEPLDLIPQVVPTAGLETSVPRIQNASKSPGPKALSTGGFPKTTRSAAEKSSGMTVVLDIALPPRIETVALPPHPLRAGRKGPLMSTTELAALLQKSSKKPKTAPDPIEYEVLGSGKSPNRSFRRVRSENDAPIPSIAEDWEKRNLSKTSDDCADVTKPGTKHALTSANQDPITKKTTGLSALIKKTDPQRKLQRTQSLSVNMDVHPVSESEPTSPVIDKDVGPWSTEAFDLFDWRPPGRDMVGVMPV